jgi:hypothetical protein
MKKNVPPGSYDVLVFAESRKPVEKPVTVRLTLRQPGFATQTIDEQSAPQLVGNDVLSFEALAVVVAEGAELIAVADHPDVRVKFAESPAEEFVEVDLFVGEDPADSGLDY